MARLILPYPTPVPVIIMGMMRFGSIGELRSMRRGSNR